MQAHAGLELKGVGAVDVLDKDVDCLDTVRKLVDRAGIRRSGRKKLILIRCFILAFRSVYFVIVYGLAAIW